MDYKVGDKVNVRVAFADTETNIFYANVSGVVNEIISSSKSDIYVVKDEKEDFIVFEENQIVQKRLFVDMDGTLARFHDEALYLERMFEKGFFRGLSAFENMTDALNSFISAHPQVEVYILSAVIDGEPPYCKDEKTEWINNHVQIDSAHMIFTKTGQNKALAIPDGITENDILFDDYNKNLDEWQENGGTSIKCKNNINHKGLNGALWDGKLIDNQASAEEIYNKLCENIDVPKESHLCIDCLETDELEPEI